MKVLLIAIALAAGAFAVWKIAFPSVSIRYRVTLEAEADGRPVRGSGVIEVDYSREPRIFPNITLHERVIGEAVTLELGSRGTLFAVLKANRDPEYAPESIVLYAFGSGFAESGHSFDWIRKLRGKVDIPLDKLWLLVRFRDINDPKTVERVDPNNIAASFGPGVRLTRATIEITDDPVTTGIEKKLGWLESYYDRRLDGQRYGNIETLNRIANSLSSGAFKSWRGQ